MTFCWNTVSMRHVVLRYVTLRYVKLCRVVVLCCAVLRYVVLWCALLCCVVLFDVKSRYVMSCHVMSCHVMLCYVMVLPFESVKFNPKVSPFKWSHWAVLFCGAVCLIICFRCCLVLFVCLVGLPDEVCDFSRFFFSGDNTLPESWDHSGAEKQKKRVWTNYIFTRLKIHLYHWQYATYRRFSPSSMQDVCHMNLV